MEAVQSRISNLIEKWHKKGLYRQRSILNNNFAGGVSFMSNDYLSLSKNRVLNKKYAQAFINYPTGSGGSPVNGGYSEAHEFLENHIAKLTGCDAAILFNSGFQANIAILALLGKLEIKVVIDKASHASIYDGIQLGKVAFSRFRHLDFNHMESQLSPGNMIITEGVFSMSGLISPLDVCGELATKYGCVLLVDEAHSFGVLGKRGMGACEQYELHQHQVPLRMISFGKSGASMGAVVVGQRNWIESLFQFARPYVYSTSMSPAYAYALRHTVDAVVEACDARQRLSFLSDYFNHKTHDSGLDWRLTNTPVKQLMLGCAEKSQKYKQFLADNNVYAQLIRTPTVPVKESGLRISLNAHHQLADIDILFDVLDNAKTVIC